MITGLIVALVFALLLVQVCLSIIRGIIHEVINQNRRAAISCSSDRAIDSGREWSGA